MYIVQYNYYSWEREPYICRKMPPKFMTATMAAKVRSQRVVIYRQSRRLYLLICLSFVSSKYFFCVCEVDVSVAKFLCYKPFAILLWLETTFLNKVLVFCLKKTSHDKGKVFLWFSSPCNYLDKVCEDWMERMGITVLRTWDILSSALSILLLFVSAYL